MTSDPCPVTDDQCLNHSSENIGQDTPVTVVVDFLGSVKAGNHFKGLDRFPIFSGTDGESFPRRQILGNAVYIGNFLIR